MWVWERKIHGSALCGSQDGSDSLELLFIVATPLAYSSQLYRSRVGKSLGRFPVLGPIELLPE